MRRILGWGALRRGRRGKSLIILFKCMRLRQCALAIFLFLFCSDLWPFGFSINTTTRMQEDVPFPRFMLLRRSAIKKFYASKFRMNSTVLKAVFALAVLSCATAGKFFSYLKPEQQYINFTLKQGILLDGSWIPVL